MLGIPDGYAQTFPGTIRTLAGRNTGVLLAQQTAANLRAGMGDTIKIAGAGTVRIDGVVDLPTADSLFQQVGAPAGAQPQAPPDNVVLLPAKLFAQLEPDARTQVHVRLDRNLPASPSAAFAQVHSRALNLEARLAGGGLVGDNLGTGLDQARADALYAQLLFGFLGVPGAILAGLVTVTIASAGADRRRRDAALMRTRGATTGQIVKLALAESALAGALGVALGLGGALAIGATVLGQASFGASTLSAVLWAGGAALSGVIVAGAAIALPAWRDARGLTVAHQRRIVGRPTRAPWWTRLGPVALLAAGLVYWQASRGGYQLVLAPEGVPQVSVNWYALLAPVLAWLGAGLVIYRVADLVLAHGRTPLARALKPLAGRLAPTVAAAMSRQRASLARAATIVALTVAFGVSTAVFNTTYRQQAEVDARLTNGADVTVTVSPGAQVDATRLAHLPGVASVEPMQHRFAYVGADLQDMYGIRPNTMLAAGKLQDAWFQGASAAQLMRTLAAKPDAVLVAAETVKDFQLQPGDLLRLRLRDANTGSVKTVPFHYAGVASEFPTAPTDSFLVANADYVARATGSSAVGSYLIQTDGTPPHTVAGAARGLLGTRARVSDIESSRRVVGSNLTAVELPGLTRVELGFALALAISGAGVALGLGFRERRRTFAIAAALGARPRALNGFVWGESAFVTGAGLAAGIPVAAVLSVVLVKVLTGVFDPPPDTLAVPWGYLVTTVTVILAASATASLLALRSLRRAPIDVLRDL